MSNNRSGEFIGGLMLGATIGALTGLLMAPRTGRETRKLLKKSADALPELAEDLSTSVQIQADRLSANALRNWDETLERLREAIAAGIDASQRESQAMKRKNPPDVQTTTSSTVADSDSLPKHVDN
ncbi:MULTISPECIES: YtxH domain-containing protein [Fischerella]|uniref:Gas vesicle protein n=1 Tax=Fischerella muscicola CCMEE 5323 TaxID=2019572 RepID=A0A2N6JVZ3_FISMU|nr:MULTISPECIES: YtxH domain-containing protein [Fischerella]MBD2432455.1 YtxH domain-containing protein [Fischerella sp. FACHB-380]PLZ83893.1 gas vesicle protein [Fischerella muscicola CCMEE 5323]